MVGGRAFCQNVHSREGYDKVFPNVFIHFLGYDVRFLTLNSMDDGLYIQKSQGCVRTGLPSYFTMLKCPDRNSESKHVRSLLQVSSSLCFQRTSQSQTSD